MCFVLSISACVTLKSQLNSKKQCETKDLYQDGYNLAVQGVPESLFASYQIKCDKYGVKLNQAQYVKERTAGLKVFCSFETGYQVGLAGKPYHNTCPKNLELDFLRGYSAGLKQNADFNKIMKTIYKNQNMYQWMLLNKEN